MHRLFKDLDDQINTIGNENINNYKMCPFCFTYIKRTEYDNHFKNIHNFNIIEVKLCESA